MNIRNVLRTYSLLRQLTDDESALLETLRGLNDAERESLVVALSPEKVAGKRASKKSSKPASKSARASGMAAALKNASCGFIYPDEKTCTEPKSSRLHDPLMGYAGYHPFQPLAPRIPQVGPNDICGKRDCGLVYADNVHHQTEHEYYHPFDPKKFARAAARRSSTNGGAGSTTASIETGSGAVGVAAGGSSE